MKINPLAAALSVSLLMTNSAVAIADPGDVKKVVRGYVVLTKSAAPQIIALPTSVDPAKSTVVVHALMDPNGTQSSVSRQGEDVICTALTSTTISLLRDNWTNYRLHISYEVVEYE